MAKYWMGDVGATDDFGYEITDEIIDAPTKEGPWALMAPKSWVQNRMYHKLGTGHGQRYRLQSDGKWLKVEG